MSRIGSAERRVSCLHCGSRNAIRWQVVDWKRYVCPQCGTYKVMDRVADQLPDPGLPEGTGRFQTDGSWDRWLVSG